MASTRWRSAAAMMTILAIASGFAACGVGRSGTVCDMSPPPSNPVEVSSSWAFGSAVVLGTIGDDLGRTRTFDPGYRTDRHAFEVERVVAVRPGSASAEMDGAPVTEARAAAITEIGNVHYPDQPPSCGGAAENASLDEGDRVLLILGPPQPTADLWTIGPATSVLDIEGEPGVETATWQHRTAGGPGGCDGHLVYELAQLEAAFAQSASSAQPGATGLRTSCDRA